MVKIPSDPLLKEHKQNTLNSSLKLSKKSIGKSAEHLKQIEKNAKLSSIGSLIFQFHQRFEAISHQINKVIKKIGDDAHSMVAKAKSALERAFTSIAVTDLGALATKTSHKSSQTKALLDFQTNESKKKAETSTKKRKKEDLILLRILDKLNGSKREGVKEVVSKNGSKILDPYYLLKKIDEISDKKIQHKAKLKLIELHLNLLGHQFSIGGEVIIQTKSIRSLVDKLKEVFLGRRYEKSLALEGANQCIAHAKITDSLANFVGSHMSNAPIHDSHLFETVEECFQNSLNVRTISQAAFDLISPQRKEGFNKGIADIVNRYNQGKPVTIGTGWDEHAVEITLYKGVMCYSNRGDMGDQGSSGIIFYAVPEGKIDRNFIEKLLITSSGSASVQEKETAIESRKKYFEEQMVADLSLIQIDYFKKSPQKIGNCTFVQAKCGLRGLLYLLLLEKKLREKGAEMKDYIELATTDSTEAKKATKPIRKDSRDLFKQWNFFNKKEQFLFFIDFIGGINPDNQIMGKAEEYKLMSKILYKFSTDKSNGSYKDHYGTYIEELMKEVRKKNYAFADCIQEFPVISSISENHKEIAEAALKKKSEGAFLLYRSKNEIIISVMGVDDSVEHQSLRFEKGSYYLEGRLQPLQSLTDLLKLDSRFKYPVWPRGIK